MTESEKYKLRLRARAKGGNGIGHILTFTRGRVLAESSQVWPNTFMVDPIYLAPAGNTSEAAIPCLSWSQTIQGHLAEQIPPREKVAWKSTVK